MRDQTETTFGQRLRQLRRGRFTQRALAEKVGLDHTYLSKLENDADIPGDDAVRRLADALGADAEDLLVLAGKVPSDLKRHAADDPDVGRLLRRLPRLPPGGMHDVLAAAGINTPNAVLVDASDLDHWADRLDAQAILPLLVQRLILATLPAVHRAEFRSGEGIQLAGWDGLVNTQRHNAFVPGGVSGWEMGTARRVRVKADGDFDRRTSDPAELTPSHASFVFVTPRRWPGKASWAAQKRRTSAWSDVRALDADDLASWLLLAPGVHVWISAELGKLPEGARPLELAWREWSEACSPALSPALTIAGRDEAVQEVRGWLAGPPAVHVIRGDASEEAVAFVASVVAGLDPAEREATLARAVVLENPGSLRQMVSSQSSLILVTRFAPSDAALAARSGHIVFVASGRDTPAMPSLDLPRLRREPAKLALVEMGLEERKAEDLATLARRSLLSLRRRLALSPAVQRPPWSERDAARDLIPAVLAGAWREDFEGDQEIIGRLAGRSYQELTANLTWWVTASDPPLRRDGPAWLLVSREDAWNLLSPLLTSHDVAVFASTLQAVLGSVNPALELPRSDRWMAGVRGLARPHSDILREALADGVLLLATGATSGNLDGQGSADAIVVGLLAAANADDTADRWSSLGDVLSLLAEASPERFLEAVDQGLAGDEPLLSRLFSDVESEPSFPSASPEHSGLLWALEGLAWSPKYLPGAAIHLARLAQLDPGGRWHNRPRNSLRELFLPWHPQTAAGPIQRLAVLDSIRSRVPEVAWRLMVDLLPRQHDIAQPTHAPRRRDWRPEGELSVTYAELFSITDGLVARIVEDAGVNGSRWAEIVGALDSLPPAGRIAIAERLAVIEIPYEDQVGREQLSDAVRLLVAEQRRVDGVPWRLPDSELDRLEEIGARFASDDPVARSTWLFTAHPNLPVPLADGWDKYREHLERARAETVREVIRHDGIGGLTRLASKVEQPWFVGYSAAELDLDVDQQAAIWSGLGPAASSERSLAQGLVAGRQLRDGWSWSEELLDRVVQAWDPAAQAAFLVGLPLEHRTWDWAENFGEETDGAYWQQIPVWALSEPSEIMRAAHKLLVADRAFVAVDVLAMGQEKLDPVDSAPLIYDALERAAASRPGADVNGTMLSYNVGHLLDYLEGSLAADTSRLARLEFLYLPLLRHGDRPAKTLHRELASSPGFFVEVLSWVFRAANEPTGELTDQDQARARLGFELLETWHQIPGLTPEGAVDRAALEEWVRDARDLLQSSGRAEIGDQRIGHVLRYSPSGNDGIWPSEPVREIIENIASTQIEIGLEVEIQNSRGVTSRGLTDGGSQERDLAARFRGDADLLRDRWHRTSALLSRVAETYERQARREDESAALTEDTWH